MSYHTNSVGVLPGAAQEKLPFVHSVFKPRSNRLAKSFGGFKKFTRHSSDTVMNDEQLHGQKLPLIYSNHEGHGNIVTFISSDDGSVKSGYPGFAGKKKTHQKRNQTTIDNRNGNSPVTLFPNERKRFKYHTSLPNLHNSEYSNFNTIPSFHKGGEQKQHRYSRKETENFNWEYNTSHSFNKSPSHKMEDSLFIFNDDEQQQNDPLEIKQDRDRTESHSFKPRRITSSFESPISELDKVIRDKRGKSGMKRGKRQEKNHVRILGDVVTTERLRELLKPRQSEVPLKFVN